jgi:hypothetical protein
MRSVALAWVLAGAALAGGCNRAGPEDKAAPSTAPSELPHTDETAIQAVLARIYAVVFDNEDAILPEMTDGFAAAWKHCHELQPKYEEATGESEGGYGKCLDDAGSFVPSTDVGLDGVKNRATKVSMIQPDVAVAEVTMQTTRNSAPAGPATVYLRMVRQAGQWKVDDLSAEGHKDGTGYRAGLANGIALMEKRIGEY